MKRISTIDGLKKRGSITGLFVAAAMFACLPQTVLAQEDGADVLEEVVVTGSNIRRNRDFETASPIQTLDNELIAASGIGQMQDLLRALPANAGSELNSTQTTRQGTSQFSLRGLGVGGTLTLINGRRAGVAPVTTNQGFFYTDINQYPPNMIERIEVLLDGASATYGSEAVGGVVNLITRKNFEGFEIGAEYRDNDNNSAESLNAAFGAGFDKGHFTAFVNYYHQDRGHRGDYQWLVDRSDGLSFVAGDNLWDSSTGAGRYDAATDPDGDGFYERSGNTVPDPNCEQPNPLSGITNTFFDGTLCRYIFLNQRTIVAEKDRLQVFTQFDYNLTDRVSIFSEISYSSNEIKDTIGGAVMDLRLDDDGHFVPAAHPFNYFTLVGGGPGVGTLTWDPVAVAADPTLAVDVITRSRPLTTFDGDLGEDIVRQFNNTRIALGFDADFNDSWSLYGSYVFSHTNLHDVQPRSYYTPAYREAIASGNWNPFASAWATPDAVSVKDGVTVAGNTIRGSDSDLAEFSVNRTFVRDTEQQVFELILSGDVFNIGGNTGAVAFGVQYRDLKFKDIADSLSEFRIDGRTDPVFSIEDGSQDVYAIFGEASVPVTDALELQVAVRYEDYGDDGGDTTDPKLGFRWQATDAFMLRGSVGTSFQAPSITNIEGSVGSGSLADPILITVFNAGPGSACDPTMTDSFNAGQVTTGGGLVPQDATNYNFGVAFTGERFTGSIDYWNYEFEDLIGAGQSHGSIVSGECSNGVYVPDPRVQRNSGGQLRSVTSSFINLGGVDTDGIDFTASYVFDDVMRGQLVLDAVATYINSFDIDSGDGSPVFDGLNNRNAFIDLLGSVPDFRLNVGANWMGENMSAGIYVRHIGGYDDREPGGVTHNSIDDNTVVDLQFGYSFEGLLGSGNTNFTLGVVNVADEDPPAIDRGSVSGRTSFDTQVHDPSGRVIYIRLLHTF